MLQLHLLFVRWLAARQLLVVKAVSFHFRTLRGFGWF
ncbi:hypothetical protein M3J07_011102 [Ascochyta lentis]